MRKRARTVVVTVVAGGLGTLGLTGCDRIGDALGIGDGPGDDELCCFNPPPPPPPPTPEAQKFPVVDEGELPAAPLADASAFSYDGARMLNASHPEYGMMYRGAGHCITYPPSLDDGPPRPPGAMGPSLEVACTEAMADFLWSQCYGGSIYTDAQGEQCVCAVFGNPPPPEVPVHCPAEANPAPAPEPEPAAQPE